MTEKTIKQLLAEQRKRAENQRNPKPKKTAKKQPNKEATDASAETSEPTTESSE